MRLSIRWAMMAMTVFLFSGYAAQAESVYDSEVNSRFAEWDAMAERLTALEAEVSAIRMEGHGASCCPPPCCRKRCCPPPSHGCIVAGFEAAMLTPHMGNVTADIPALGGPISLLPDYNMEFSPRVFLGYVGPGGLGVRLRYWQFDHSARGDSAVMDLIEELSGEQNNFDLSLEAHALDLEATQQGMIGNWELQAAGGVRYATLSQGFNVDFVDPAADDFGAFAKFEGVGPTFALQARRPLFDSGLSLFGAARGSLLFGTTRLRGTGDLSGVNAFDIEVTRHLLKVWELQIGAEYAYVFEGGARLFTRAAYEAQVWEVGSVLGLGGSDVGFVGPTFSVGLLR